MSFRETVWSNNKSEVFDFLKINLQNDISLLLVMNAHVCIWCYETGKYASQHTPDSSTSDRHTSWAILRMINRLSQNLKKNAYIRTMPWSRN